MKEQSIIDTLFPEPDEPDMLGGLPDFTGGAAKRYFQKLNPDDRELVQWFLQLGLNPYRAEPYVFDLAKGYAIVDPERKYKEAQDLAHKEVRRVERFMEIFLDSKSFFPAVRTLISSEKDENGRWERIQQRGWARMEVFGTLKDSKDMLREQLPLFTHVHAFIDDPRGTEYFDQERIIREAREKRFEN